MQRLNGVIVPMVSPLTAEGEIDEESTARLVEHLLAGGVSGVFALGSSGECVALAWPKQLRLLRAVVKCVRGRVPVCAGLCSNSLEETFERAGAIAEAGADFAVVLTPYYFRTSQREMVRFFGAVADRSPLPVVAYNIPFRTNNTLEPPTINELRRHPNFVGLKDTVNDFARTLAILGDVRGDASFSYMHGNELLALPAAAAGAAGCVVSIANFAPAFMVEAWNAAAGGAPDAIARYQPRIAALMKVFGLLEARPQDSTVLRLMAIKAALEVLGVMKSHMAQLAPAPSDELLAPVRRFVEENEILPRSAL
ncbi:MAG: dihydrodipicolinate synthase family protein [Bryobacteraceae bacterium]